MNVEQENFDQLRKLLALKRHEQPPPGYFHHFSQEVIARIRAGEHLEPAGFRSRLGWDAPWLERFWSFLEGRPAFAGAFGLAVCGLLFSGIFYAEPGEDRAVASSFRMPEAATHLVVEKAPIALGNPALPRVVAADSSMAGVISFQGRGSLLQTMARPQVQPLIYTVPLGN